jgi:hypothetical protein
MVDWACIPAVVKVYIYKCWSRLSWISSLCRRLDAVLIGCPMSKSLTFVHLFLNLSLVYSFSELLCKPPIHVVVAEAGWALKCSWFRSFQTFPPQNCFEIGFSFRLMDIVFERHLCVLKVHHALRVFAVVLPSHSPMLRPILCESSKSLAADFKSVRSLNPFGMVYTENLLVLIEKGLV